MYHKLYMMFNPRRSSHIRGTGVENHIYLYSLNTFRLYIDGDSNVKGARLIQKNTEELQPKT